MNRLLRLALFLVAMAPLWGNASILVSKEQAKEKLGEPVFATESTLRFEKGSWLITLHWETGALPTTAVFQANGGRIPPEMVPKLLESQCGAGWKRTEHGWENPTHTAIVSDIAVTVNKKQPPVTDTKYVEVPKEVIREVVRQSPPQIVDDTAYWPLGVLFLWIFILWLKAKMSPSGKNQTGEIEELRRQLKAEHDHVKEDAARIMKTAKASAEREVAVIRKEAKEEADAIRKAAKELKASAEKEAAAILKSAKEKEEKPHLKVAEIFQHAYTQQAYLIRQAQKAAQERPLELTVIHDELIAARSKLEGYDAFVSPNPILVELAETVQHSKAAQLLKGAETAAKKLEELGRAVSTDYVDAVKKHATEQFMLQNFLNEVKVLSQSLKRENIGATIQKLKDARTRINIQGSAFQNAKITDEYLQAHIHIMELSDAIFTLKEEEKEEQRRLREQIKEEERVQREARKALEEAERAEKEIAKALEKAREEMAKATDAEREKYAQQLKDLEDKLAAAEAKGQRALSMAQQTRCGHVYVISNIGSFGDGVFKIGLTRRLEPLDRVKELGDASVPFRFDVHAMIPSQDAPALETALHRKFALFQVNKMNPRKEFFRIPLSKIREEIEGLGIDATWTIAAEAEQYRETLALEKQLETDPAKQEEWLKSQAQFECEVLSEEETTETP